MSVKSVVAERLEKAQSFADSVRAVYDSAYNKATEVRKNGVSELIKDIQPMFRTAVEDGIHGAQTVLDEFNQSLADKAIPSFRKGAVSREQLEQKAKGVLPVKKQTKPAANASSAVGAGAQAKPKRVKASEVKRAASRNKAVKKPQMKK